MNSTLASAPRRDPGDVIRKFCESFPQQVQSLQLIHSRVASDVEPDVTRIEYLQKEVHRLGGSAHCMGFRLVGTELLQLENEIEALMKSPPEAHMDMLAAVGKKLENIERFAKYVQPANARPPSVEFETAPETTTPILSRRLAKLMAEQRILFADDDEPVRALMGSMLQLLGVGAVKTVDSGAEALRIAASFRPTILMTDWNMQPIDGLELLSMIRKGESNLPTNTSVIFLTSQSNVTRVRSAMREGVDHFLVKPFTREVIVRAIEIIATKKSAEG